LYWAWGDLDYENEQQSYWPGATADNIESIVKETAEQWLTKKSETLYTSKLSSLIKSQSLLLHNL
jgi:hypothetical protein